ncbi:4168_t:CDS:2, partial [Rhizophagus irregularis]
VTGISSSFMFPQESTLDNASEILSSLEILLCFVKRTAVGDGEISIKDYVSRWMKLSSLYAHEGFARFLNIDLRLKHLVALYEFVEEQVANLKIKYIHDKYKAQLSTEMRNAIIKSVDFEQQTTTKEMISAEAFALALKRFMLRFLTLENQKEMEPLYVYLTDNSLNFWPSTIPEKRIEALFPEILLVANTYDAYDFTMRRIEQTMETINANNTMRQNNLGPRNPNIGQRTTPTSRQQRKPKGGSRYDIT